MDPLVFTLILIAGGALLISWASGNDAPFIPTSSEDFKKVLQKAGLCKGKIFYDLGSGDGRVVFEAAKLGADSYGIEQSWLRVYLARLLGKRMGLKNVHFFHGNIFTRHYFPVDFVYVSLSERGVRRVEKVLRKELKKGAAIITHKHHFKDWEPKQKIDDFWIYQN